MLKKTENKDEEIKKKPKAKTVKKAETAAPKAEKKKKTVSIYFRDGFFFSKK